MADAGVEQRLRELFDRAVSLPPDQREQVIAGAGDELLAERLRALLAQDALGTAGVLRGSPQRSLDALRRIGRYELLRELGSGGMGTVVLARQLEPVERLVALKMVHAGADGQDVMQRFATERQALAVMNHPGIARIFDGGSADDGEPYFVMEYVRGEPVTGYCDRRRLAVPARLDLFVEVCDAVQHAHQKGVLHRDLKPGNVLVTEEAGRPRPKIIDFGVALALSGLRGQQPVTSAGVAVGTLGYMSPEQADPAGQDVDTRADIYSLGVLLYELLTGELPLAVDLDKEGWLGLQRTLLETPPPRASSRVLALPGERAAAAALVRGTTTPALQRQLHGDLDWILACALEKDRNRRYASAAALAADLQRHRRLEPVEAGPPTLRYRFGRLVRRHRLVALATALVVLGLLVGIAGSTRGMLVARAAHEAEVASHEQLERQLLRQRAVGEFSEFLLFYGEPGTGGSPPSLRHLLDTLTPAVVQRLHGRPIEEAAVRAAVGRAYLTTGEPAKAESELRAAWQLVAVEDELDAAVACLLLHDLSRAQRLAGGPGAGRGELAQMLELGARAIGGPEPGLARRLYELAGLLRRPGAEWPALQTGCEELLEQVARAPWDAEPTRIAARLVAAVGMRLQEEEVPGSERFLDRLEAVARESLGADVDFLQVLGRFAESQLRQRQFASARRLAKEVQEALARLGLGDHWLALRAERIRGLSLALDGEEAAGETALLALVRHLQPLPSAANEQTRAAANALAELCAGLQAAKGLEAFLEASLQRWLAAAAGDPEGAPWWPADADGLPAAATATASACVGRAPGNETSPRLLFVHGSLLLRQDRAEAAAAALERALAGMPQPAPELLADLAVARARIGNAAAAAVVAADLRALCARGDPVAPRCQRALQRLAAAGLR